MKKRLLASLLTLVMLLGLLPTAVFAVEEPPENAECVCTVLCEGEDNSNCPVCAEDPDKCQGEAKQSVQDEEDKDENVIYVSQSGTGEGTSVEDAKGFDDAMTNAKDGDVFAIVGTVTKDLWTTPSVGITIKGAYDIDDETVDDTHKAVLKITGTKKTPIYEGISMQGDLTIQNIKLEIGQKDGYYGSLVHFYANGHTLTIGEKVSAEYPGGNYGGSSLEIFGGGPTDIEQDTNVVISAKLEGSATVYGGGYNANVKGDTHVTLNGGYVGSVFGGGYAYNDATKPTANIDGDTNVILKNAEVSAGTGFTGAVYGGGEAYSAGKTVNVTGTANVWIEDSSIRTVTIYGGSDVHQGATSDIKQVNLTIKNTPTSSNYIFAGSNIDNSNSTTTGHAHVESAEVKLIGTSSTALDIYGGGYGYASLVKNVSVTLEGVSALALYAGGYGYSSNIDHATVEKATITIDNSRVTNLYTSGRSSKVENEVKIILKNAVDTLSEKDTAGSYPFNIFNSSLSSKSENPTANTTIIAESGRSKITKIRGVPTITVKNGGTLEQYHSTKANLFDKFDENTLCGNVTIEEGGILYLKSANEISGTFTSAGTLKMPAPYSSFAGNSLLDAALTVGGTVTVQAGASYVPVTSSGMETNYVKGDVFVRSKTQPTQNTTEVFAVSETGNEQGYFTADREVTGDSSDIVHEWYVNQIPIITITPLTLTKYVTPKHDHEDDDCFPDPRYEGLESIPNGANFTVDGDEWTEAGYPFTIKYYDANNVELEDDNKPGVYTAKIVPVNDTYDIDDIGITGCKVVFGDGELHIRAVSDTADTEGLEDLASKVSSTVPAEKVTEAVAVYLVLTRRPTWSTTLKASTPTTLVTSACSTTSCCPRTTAPMPL